MVRNVSQLYNTPISTIIRQSVSSREDLETLCQRLGFDVDFCWIDDYEPTMRNAIVNIDADHIGGSHWCAIYNNEFYFDPLGLPIARNHLDYLQYTSIQIQDPNHGGCGQYAVLWLWYANNNDMEGFYALF